MCTENIRKFYNACLQPDRITIGCTGVEHNELCNYLEQFFGSLQPSDFSILDTSSARFIGGTVHHHVDEAPVHPATQSPLAYVSLGFQVRFHSVNMLPDIIYKKTITLRSNKFSSADMQAIAIVVINPQLKLCLCFFNM